MFYFLPRPEKVHFYLFLRQMQDDRNFFITLTLYIPKLHNQPLFIGEFIDQTMVYGGLVNKNIVAGLQARGVNALGLTGADMDVIRSVKRPVKDVDYGFVGDVKQVNAEFLGDLIHKGIVPVMAPLTHDGAGNLLNTNADTIAGETAKALAALFDVTLVFCFEKKGVLRDENDDDSVIPQITPVEFKQYVADGVIQGGMIPKLENSFEALNAGVTEVVITLASAINENSGTRIKK